MSKMFQSFLTTEGISDIASGDVAAFRSWIQKSGASATEPHGLVHPPSISTVQAEVAWSPSSRED